MSNLIEMLETKTERTPEQNEAIYLHEQIVMSCQMVGNGLVGISRNLKEMRDKKLYVQLGYEDFGTYTEQEHGIKQRMAYNYISAYERLGVAFLQSNAKLGITKLLEIAALDREERAELMEAHSTEELADMSTEEVKRLTEQVKKLEEQLTFLQEEKRQRESEPAQVVQQPFDELEADIRAEVEREIENKHSAEIAEMESKIAALEARSMSDEELKKYRENAEKEAKAAAAEETKKLKADLKAANEAKKLESEKLDKILEEKKNAEERVKIAEEQAKHATELEAKIAAAEAEKAAMEKQIKLSADPEFTRFKFLFEAWQNATNALVEQLGKLDADKQTKSKAAVRKVVEVNGL